MATQDTRHGTPIANIKLNCKEPHATLTTHAPTYAHLRAVRGDRLVDEMKYYIQNMNCGIFSSGNQYGKVYCVINVRMEWRGRDGALREKPHQENCVCACGA